MAESAKRHRYRYNLEANATTKQALDYVQNRYGLSTAAEAWRQALQDELLLLKFSETPESRSAWRVLTREHSRDVSVLDLALFSGVPDGANQIKEIRALLEDVDAKMETLLYHASKLGTNLNQVAKQLNAVAPTNANYEDLAKLIVQFYKTDIQPMYDTTQLLKEVIHHAGTYD
ncbi:MULTISPECIES: plasmid mobilization relaxosome protein MobC [Lactiplantibacillus]|uniref:Plasmid mobilization relaxosome protein MobC n=1 Tax=Lactiplantibacillus plajomi TaxID=1457217 RepID=A0ABV6K4N5_9LACO|nr:MULTISPECIES: plasmid mobilization relaxosome protein MobC [Lactiplantibacillus]